MPDQPQQNEPSANEPGGHQARRDHGWRGAWGLLIALFVVLAAVCGYWLITLGAAKAFERGEFVVTLILAILVLICIGARLMVRMLRAGTVIDNRNFIDLSCSQRFRRH